MSGETGVAMGWAAAVLVAAVLAVAVPVFSAVAVPGASVAVPGAGISWVAAKGSVEEVWVAPVSGTSKAAAAPTLIWGPLPRMDLTSTISLWACSQGTVPSVL